MKMHIYGNENAPRILCVHPLLGNSESACAILQKMTDDFCIVCPDLTAHGTDDGELISAAHEAEVLTEYLSQNKETDFRLTVGFSMGALVVLYALSRTDISFGKIVLEGAPLYEYGGFMQKIVATAYRMKQKQAATKPDAYFREVKKQFGSYFVAEYGEAVWRKFVEMSDKTLANGAASCAHFDFPTLSKTVQKNLHFRYGSKESNAKNGAKQIARHYPYASLVIKGGYDHCEYPFKNREEYAKMLTEILEGKD